MLRASASSEIAEFLRTGDYDVLFSNFPGSGVLERASCGHQALVDALLAEVRRRESRAPAIATKKPPSDIQAFARRKLQPMVSGLFRRDEVEAVLNLLQDAIVFLTPTAIKQVVQSENLGSAWDLANLYLRSIGADPVSDQAPDIVGLSAGVKCFVSIAYFDTDDPFSDYVVHEAAHVFHNTKRRTIGFKETRNKVWLLPIAFRKRETFAYACEAYSRIRELGRSPKDRQCLLHQLHDSYVPPDDRVDVEEFFSILTEAVGRRNGWKAILKRCSTMHE